LTLYMRPANILLWSCRSAVPGVIVASGGLDLSSEYARNARLKPAFLVALPVAALAATWGLSASVLLGVVSGPLAAAGLTYLLAHLSRDFGVRKQETLFRNWGGKPSVAKLRHRDTTLNCVTRARYHQKAAELLGRSMPTAAEEEADPVAADLLYEAYSNLLLERTRDTKTYRLLFDELISYGFRRNLYGMKPLGATLSAFAVTLQTVSLVLAFRTGHQVDVTKAVFLGLNLFLLTCWLFMITPAWVKRSANSYAERLLAASENLQPSARRGDPRHNAKPRAAVVDGRSNAKRGSAAVGGSET